MSEAWTKAARSFAKHPDIGTGWQRPNCICSISKKCKAIPGADPGGSGSGSSSQRWLNPSYLIITYIPNCKDCQEDVIGPISSSKSALKVTYTNVEGHIFFSPAAGFRTFTRYRTVANIPRPQKCVDSPWNSISLIIVLYQRNVMHLFIAMTI